MLVVLHSFCRFCFCCDRQANESEEGSFVKPCLTDKAKTHKWSAPTCVAFASRPLPGDILPSRARNCICAAAHRRQLQRPISSVRHDARRWERSHCCHAVQMSYPRAWHLASCAITQVEQVVACAIAPTVELFLFGRSPDAAAPRIPHRSRSQGDLAWFGRPLFVGFVAAAAFDSWLHPFRICCCDTAPGLKRPLAWVQSRNSWPSRRPSGRCL